MPSRRKDETPVEYLARKAEYQKTFYAKRPRKLRSEMTPEELAILRGRQAGWQRGWRRKPLTEEQREARNARERENYKKRMAAMTPVQRKAYAASRNAAHQRYRAIKKLKARKKRERDGQQTQPHPSV